MGRLIGQLTEAKQNSMLPVSRMLHVLPHPDATEKNGIPGQYPVSEDARLLWDVHPENMHSRKRPSVIPFRNPLSSRHCTRTASVFFQSFLNLSSFPQQTVHFMLVLFCQRIPEFLKPLHHTVYFRKQCVAIGKE